MEAYSMDLRERVITAYDRGDGSSRELAEVFGVSGAWSASFCGFVGSGARSRRSITSGARSRS